MSLSGLPAVPLEEVLAWDEPVHDHPNWRLLLDSLEWTYPLIAAAAAGDMAAHTSQ